MSHDDGVTKMRDFIAGGIALVATIFICFQFESIQEKRRIIGALERDAEFSQKRTNRRAELIDIYLLDNLKTSELQEIASELRGWLDKLELEQNGKANDDLTNERTAMIDLWDAIEKNVNNRTGLDIA